MSTKIKLDKIFIRFGRSDMCFDVPETVITDGFEKVLNFTVTPTTENIYGKKPSIFKALRHDNLSLKMQLTVEGRLNKTNGTLCLDTDTLKVVTVVDEVGDPATNVGDDILWLKCLMFTKVKVLGYTINASKVNENGRTKYRKRKPPEPWWLKHSQSDKSHRV